MKEAIINLYINQFILFETMEKWNAGKMEQWNNGILEKWNDGKMEEISKNLTSCFDFVEFQLTLLIPLGFAPVPLFHHSIIPTPQHPSK